MRLKLTTLCALCLLLSAGAYAGGGRKAAPQLLFNQKDIETQRSKESVQGTAIWGDLLFSMRNTGLCVVSNLADATLVAEFPLGSVAVNNHANDAFFGVDYYEEGDRFPLLYVSQCKSGTMPEIDKPELDGLSRLLLVERILTDADGLPVGADLVQVISYEPSEWNSRLWCFDPKHPDSMVCYGNVKGNARPGNRIVVETYPMPRFDRSRFVVTISESDRIDRFYMDQALPEGVRGPQDNILQGGCVYDGILYMPVGVGYAKYPSDLFAVDLNRRDAAGLPYRYYAADYTAEIPCEMEDVDIWQGRYLVCTTNSHGRVRPVYCFRLKDFKFRKR